jgi:hypothetical protein
MWRWLYRRANRCKTHYDAHDPFWMTCNRHGFRTQSPTELQAHVMDEIIITEKALNRRVP